MQSLTVALVPNIKANPCSFLNKYFVIASCFELSGHFLHFR